MGRESTTTYAHISIDVPLSLSLTLSLSLSLSLSHTHTHTHSLTLMNTHEHTRNCIHAVLNHRLAPGGGPAHLARGSTQGGGTYGPWPCRCHAGTASTPESQWECRYAMLDLLLCVYACVFVQSTVPRRLRD